jgi:hypothetical protein
VLPDEPPAASHSALRRWRVPIGVALVLLIGFLAVRAAWRSFDPLAPLNEARKGRTTITNAVIAGKVQSVARLVSSETLVRDVVTYENTRLGSTKRALVVVSARVLAGIDLERGTEVKVDHLQRRVRIVIPAASVLGVEITEMRTWDERSGLWNRFTPADRDTIFTIAREQLTRTAEETGALAHANTSARRVLEALVSGDGYATEIVVRGADGREIRDEGGVELK